MKKLYKGIYYFKIDLGVETTSDYYMSRFNKIIRVTNGQIFEFKAKIASRAKYLEATIANTYNPLTGNCKRILKTYNQIYASIFYKGKTYFALREIGGTPVMLTREAYAKLTAPRLATYAGRKESNSKIKSSQLPKLAKLRKTHTLKQLGVIYKCSPTAVSRALAHHQSKLEE